MDMTTAEFQTLLIDHDWHFERSDDSRAYQKGLREQSRLLHLCQQNPEWFRLYNHANRCIINNSSITFDTEGMTPEVQKTTNTTYPDTMKEVLALVFAALIQPLVDAIKENTAAVLGKGYAAPAPATTEAEVIPPADKPKGKAGAKKNAEAQPAESTGKKYSHDDIKILAKSLPDQETKDKCRAWMKKQFSVENIPELTDEQVQEMAEKLISKGAKLEATAPGDW